MIHSVTLNDRKLAKTRQNSPKLAKTRQNSPKLAKKITVNIVTKDALNIAIIINII
jgi:hypothetical protein